MVGVTNVTRPTMTVYSPTGKNTGAAVVVFPGGGYQMLAIDLEGSEVCDWLTPKGITCVLLKYRVTDVGPYPKSGPYPESPMALEDAQRTLGLVQAQDDHVDSVYFPLAYYLALVKAGVPSEMHMYAHGGHAFGLRRTRFPITGWPELVETWLGTIGMIPE